MGVDGICLGVVGVIATIGSGSAAASGSGGGPLGFVQVLDAPPGDKETSFFGYAVAADGDLVLIGGRNPVGSSAADWVVDAYRFVDGAWVHVQTVDSPDPVGPSGLSFFGQSIDVDGTLAVIGDTQGLSGGGSNGAAYVYEWDGSQWVFRQKLVSPTPLSYDNYALTLGISGSTVVVTASSYEIPGGPVFVGLTCVYERDAAGVWTLTQAISEPDITGLFPGEKFAFEGDTIVLGSIDQIADYRPHVLRRNEAGLFEYDLSFPISYGSTTLQAGTLDIDQGEVLVFQSNGGGGFTSALGMIGFSRDQAGNDDWTLSTLVQDPSPGEVLSPSASHWSGRRSGDTIVMSVGLQQSPGAEVDPVHRTLAFHRGKSGSWEVQSIAPPAGVDGTEWSVHAIEPNDADGWFLASDLTGLVAFYEPIESNPEPPCPGDIDGDGVVDSDDLGVLLGAFGGVCP